MEYEKQKQALGFWRISPTPSKEEWKVWQASYSEKYYQNYQKEYSPAQINFINNKARILEFIWNNFSQKPGDGGRFLDIGCGEGFFLKFFHEKAWNVEGTDFSSVAIEKYNKEFMSFFTGGDIYKVIQLKTQQGVRYDFLNAEHFFEHADDPVEFLRKLRCLMHKNSLLRITTPNDFSAFQEFLITKGIVQDEYWFCPPTHLNYFSVSSLKKTLEALDFKIHRIIMDFPIEMYLANECSNYWRDKSKGADAHKARILLDEFFMNQGIEKYVSFMEALGNCSFGRQITAYVYLA